MEGRVEGMILLYLIWMFLKLVRGKGVISPSLYLNVLKIRMRSEERRVGKECW